jgi:hypothetical protein
MCHRPLPTLLDWRLLASVTSQIPRALNYEQQQNKDSSACIYYNGWRLCHPLHRASRIPRLCPMQEGLMWMNVWRQYSPDPACTATAGDCATPSTVPLEAQVADGEGVKRVGGRVKAPMNLSCTATTGDCATPSIVPLETHVAEIVKVP